jgi:hypothetical protein
MKLNNRLHNVSFSLHTVTGVILCTVLFVIFYCGALSLFKPEIDSWEHNINGTTNQAFDYHTINGVYAKIETNQNNYGRSMVFYDFVDKTNFSLYIEGDSIITDQEYVFNTNLIPEPSTYSLSHLIYELHFLNPIPSVGIYIAGIVCIIFILSIFTGILIHLKNFFRSFFLVRKKKGIKTFLKDTHIVFGVITLPFQLLYAITGVVFAMLIVLIIPQVLVQYKVDTTDMEMYMKDVQPTLEISHCNYSYDNLNETILDFEQRNHVDLSYLRLYNFADPNMQGLFVGKGVNISSDIKELITLKNNEIVLYKSSENAHLIDLMDNWFRGLHFGDFGGIAIRLIYLFLALLSCIVFYSGGLLWLETRKKQVKRLELYFIGFIWGLLITTICSFILRQYISYVSIYFLSIWLLWSCLTLILSRNNFIKYSKWSLTVLTLMFCIVYLINVKNLDSTKLWLPCIHVIATLFFTTYKPKTMAK